LDYPTNPLEEGMWKKMKQPHISYMKVGLQDTSRFHHLGCYFMELADCIDAPKKGIILCVRLLWG
jgi:hypothetical protein